MLDKEINKLKELLDKQIEYGTLSDESVLSISRSLDKLIIEYYKEKLKLNN